MFINKTTTIWKENGKLLGSVKCPIFIEKMDD
jgi:hypothetical protein